MTCVIPDADTVNRWFVAPVRDASPAWAVLPADAGEHDDRPPCGDRFGALARPVA